ncbi:MAG: ATP-dependent helicase RecG [Microbacteriaceae bacterium]|nr:ATP-dependent helicase RecG [Microbacteriaceae bacterium]
MRTVRLAGDNRRIVSIQVINVSAEQVEHILGLEEGHFLDLKRKEIAPDKLTRTIAAFANADGGELYIGIGEDNARTTRFWEGFEGAEDANGHIQPFEALFPLGHGFEYEFLRSEAETGLVLHVYVAKGAAIKKASNDVVYVRRGAQNLPQETNEELGRLERAKGLSSFEADTVATDLADVADSLAVIGFMIEVIPEGDPETWLRKQRLIVQDMPTVACVLLFADEPQAHLPKAAVKVYRYSTDAAEGTRETLVFDPETVEGNLYQQIIAAVARVTQIIEGIQVHREEGLVSINYPPETLHEIITNAVLHRDYSMSDDVHVRIFDNRVEVESPGRLPAHITPDNILRERFARNASVVRIINKFPNPPNKDVGEGLNTAFSAMTKLRLREPEIKEADHSTLVIIRHEPLASPEAQVIKYLDDNQEINNSTAREITKIESEGKMRRILQAMVASSELERVPGKIKGGSAYRKPKR